MVQVVGAGATLTPLIPTSSEDIPHGHLWSATGMRFTVALTSEKNLILHIGDVPGITLPYHRILYASEWSLGVEFGSSPAPPL